MNRLAEFIRKSGLTVQQIADCAGLTRDSVNRIKAGQVNLNEEKLYKFSKIFNCYPSELLPLEWQKPALYEVDPDILAKAALKIEEILEAREKIGDKPLELEEKCKIISHYYNEIINKQTAGEKNVIKIDNNS